MKNQLILNYMNKDLKFYVKIFVMDEKIYDELYKWQHRLSYFFFIRYSDKSPNGNGTSEWFL